jgi:hypothetical protein
MAMMLAGWGGYVPMKSIINGFQVRTQSGVQFMQSLSDFIYIYVFGERMAPVTISGVSFANVCERQDEAFTDPNTGETVFSPNYHGLEYVMSYYNAFRVSTTGAPVTIVLGLSTVLFGFLTDASIALSDVDTQMATFSLEFKAVPQVNLIALLQSQPLATMIQPAPAPLQLPLLG